jgi:hypothetical protein
MHVDTFVSVLRTRSAAVFRPALARLARFSLLTRRGAGSGPGCAQVVQGMLQQDLSALMRSHLRAEEAQVLTLRFGLDDGCARTIRQVGEELGIPCKRCPSATHAHHPPQRRMAQVFEWCCCAGMCGRRDNEASPLCGIE